MKQKQVDFNEDQKELSALLETWARKVVEKAEATNDAGLSAITVIAPMFANIQAAIQKIDCEGCQVTLRVWCANFFLDGLGVTIDVANVGGAHGPETKH